MTSLNNRESAPRIGLALGSGASRGWSHLGIVKALLKAGIEPDIVCGTSVGAMVGAAYLTGKMQELEDWVLGTTRTDVLRFFDVNFKRSGFVDTKRFSWFLHTYVAGEEHRIEDLPKQFAAIMTHLDTGREIWINSGNLAEAVRASMALPGLFPAVRLDGRWMVDGGLVNPVPVSVCHAMGADVVIAVNLNSGIVGKHAVEARKPQQTEENGMLGALKQQARSYSSAIFPTRGKDEDAPGLFYAIATSINIFQDRITRSRLAGDPADIVLSPKVAQIGMLEFHRAGEAIAEGERCVNNAMTELRRITELPSDHGSGGNS